MRTCGALALRSPSSGVPIARMPDLARAPPTRSHPRRRVQPPRPRSLPDHWSLGGRTEPLRAIEPQSCSVDGGAAVKDRVYHERRRQY
eukprot:2115538-Pleurochrysis_carterae.AAC.1